MIGESVVLLLLPSILLTSTCWAFTSRSMFAGQQIRMHRTIASASHAESGCASIVMRDASASYWFRIGDAVRVVDDVVKAGENLRERQGVVVETWEKCDVDPTCCCAEQVDLGMAVRVEFQGSERSIEEEGSFFHYFAEDELLKQDLSEASQLPFNGMSCRAFKLDQLQLDRKPRGIASFEPTRAEDDG